MTRHTPPPGSDWPVEHAPVHADPARAQRLLALKRLLTVAALSIDPELQLDLTQASDEEFLALMATPGNSRSPR